MKNVLRWLDHRTGIDVLMGHALNENVPGGSRWRYVWGSTLTFTFMVQVITGFFLWASYSPSAQTAWPSVYYIQHEMMGGWLLRGIHHFTAQAMIVLLGLHMLQVVWDGAYRAPREVNFWFGLLLLHLVLALSLTGYLLPWDQKGYWATKVATNIAGIAPVFGPAIQRVLMGGPDYGHLTLTRFFALHAGVLPSLIMILIVGHIYLFRRHGLTVKEPRRRPDQTFWPDQLLKDAIACLLVIATVLALVLRHAIGNSGESLGAELGAPADPTEPFSAARPEWYFLFMFQFLKLFPGGTEVWGAIILPTFVLIFLFLMPFIGKSIWGHRANLIVLASLIAGIFVLTLLAWRQDVRDPRYMQAVNEANAQAKRAIVLAQSPTGIPPTGALTLMREDPLTQGPKLFAKNCASCHRYDGHDGLGNTVPGSPTAADLKGFASREWLTRFLDTNFIDSPVCFGGTRFKSGRMVFFVKKKIAAYTPENQENLRKVIKALSAEAALKSQAATDAKDAEIIKQGAAAITDPIACISCHRFHNDDPDATAPNLTGYGSRLWMIGMISNPAAPEYYGTKNDRMPAFHDKQILDNHSIELIVDWLRGDWYEPGTNRTDAATPAK